MPEECTRYTLVLEYNNVEQLRQVFSKSGDSIAGGLLNPFAGNMNLIKPSEDFVQALRVLTEQYGALLIYDEVI